jgi:acetylornithine aminotransferase
METFEVYKLWPIEPVRAAGCKVWDAEGVEYLDLYGGHAVISVGHSHPRYVKAIQEQVARLGFYSNAVQNPLQTKLAQLLGEASGYVDYSLFLSNSGAEANENALKLASFHTGRPKVLAFKGAFHGRTSGAVAVTDNPKIVSPFNARHEVAFVALDDIEGAVREIATEEYAAVIIEGIQGVSGIHEPSAEMLHALREATKKHGTVLILDEIQSGYGRTGRFFAHQHAGIEADIITTAKGMGNGFPIGGTLIAPTFKPVAGMLGTTFGGNHLACAAAIAVLEIMRDEHLVEAAAAQGEYLLEKLQNLAAEHPEAIRDIRGRGLMVGIDIADTTLRDKLLFQNHIFTGAAGANIIRLLPPLTVSHEELDKFLTNFAFHLF